MLYIGSHVGFNKSNHTRNPIIDELTLEALSIMKENNMDYSKVIVHAPYIMNLCNEEKFSFSVEFLTHELERVNQLGIKYLVLHPGSHVGQGIETGINRIIEGINMAFQNRGNNNQVTILLETMAGKGTEVGTNIQELKKIIEVDHYLDEFDQEIGIEKIGCIHINDSKNEKSSHKDRHENIGFGTIGFDTLISIIYNERLKNIPRILETPYVDRLYPPYQEEIEMIRKKEFNKDFINIIKNKANNT